MGAASEDWGGGGCLEGRAIGFKPQLCRPRAGHLTPLSYSCLIYEANINIYFILNLYSFKKLKEIMNAKYFHQIWCVVSGQ